MNILRWKRKSKKKIKLKSLVLIIFSLIMTTFAWFAYSKVLDPTLRIHMVSWDMEYYIGTDKKTNPIAIDINTLYPTMPEQSVTIDIFNNGESLVDIAYTVQSVTIAGTTFEIVPEGETNTTEDYIALAKSVRVTDEAEGIDIYKGIITNDITKFPFTIEVEHSAEVVALTEDEYGNKVPGEGYLKVTVNWLGDNDLLDSEWGYKVGEFFANNPTETTAMSIVISVDSYQTDPNGTSEDNALQSTIATRPYLPDGFTRMPGTNLSTGLVISDANKNEYVWIEVPRSLEVYPNAGINITSFSDTELNRIESDLKIYSRSYRTREDTFTNYAAIGLAEDNYYELKKKMLKSIYSYGGFYIGRYETGIASGYRTKHTSSAPTETPVVKANVYPFNYVTCSQAHTLSTKLAPTGHSSSLLFGLQWDLVMKYLETKGASQATLKTDSTTWGNYKNNSYTLTKTGAEYMPGTEWLTTIPYEKPSNQEVLIRSGASNALNRQNIYDLAGNLAEWTYNIVSDGTYLVGGNGGDYLKLGTANPVSSGGSNIVTTGVKNVGFRVALMSNTPVTEAWGGTPINIFTFSIDGRRFLYSY